MVFGQFIVFLRIFKASINLLLLKNMNIVNGVSYVKNKI